MSTAMIVAIQTAIWHQPHPIPIDRTRVLLLVLIHFCEVNHTVGLVVHTLLLTGSLN